MQGELDFVDSLANGDKWLSAFICWEVTGVFKQSTKNFLQSTDIGSKSARAQSTGSMWRVSFSARRILIVTVLLLEG